MKRIVSIAILTTFAGMGARGVGVSGMLKHEFFKGATRAQVEDGTVGAPTSLEYINSFELPADVDDNYTRRVSGFFVPPTTGNYVFFVTSDDDSDLFLSTDDSPANKRLIAQETAWSNALEWTASAGGSNTAQKRSDQFKPAGSSTAPFASGIPLTAGTRYYIEGVHHEGGGGDNFAATYKLMSDPDPANGSASTLTGNIIALEAPDTPSVIAQPANRRVLAGQTITLSTVVDPPNATLQWFKNGTAIAGATSATYDVPAITAGDANATFHVVATSNGTSVQSSNAVITVGQSVPLPAAKQELWLNATRADVEAGTQDSVTPDRLLTLPTFEVPNDQGDNYAERVSALFKPAVTGDYVFFISSDDDSDLFLSTDETPANKRRRYR